MLTIKIESQPASKGAYSRGQTSRSVSGMAVASGVTTQRKQPLLFAWRLDW